MPQMKALARLLPIMVIVLASCTDSTGTVAGIVSSPQDSGTVTVTVGNNFFQSDRNKSLNDAVDTIPVGGKVRWRWVNTSAVPHNIASLGTPSFMDGPVKTGSGNSYELTFTTPGVYRYNCAIHGNLMTGVVVVAPAAPPAMSPPPTMGLLTDVVIPRLPSPYYHFEYDAADRVVKASFASGLRMYDVVYAASGRIQEMRANTIASLDRLVYAYDDSGRVATVRYVDQGGATFWVATFFTYAMEKLVGIERALRSTGGFVVDKTMAFSYYPDGNLFELAEYRPTIDGYQTEATTVDRFESYDNGINVDDFALIHDEFFDHLVLLPSVHLQRNSPGRQIRTGDTDNFTAQYRYTYDRLHRPVAKIGDLTILTGAQAGQRYQFESQFSYY